MVRFKGQLFGDDIGVSTGKDANWDSQSEINKENILPSAAMIEDTRSETVIFDGATYSGVLSNAFKASFKSVQVYESNSSVLLLHCYTYTYIIYGIM